MVMRWKIVPQNGNDLKRHLRRQDQRDNRMFLLGTVFGSQAVASSLEKVEAPLPPPKPRCKLVYPKQLGPCPVRLELPFPKEYILSGYEDGWLLGH